MSDLIDRKAVLDAFHTWFRDGFDEDKWWNSTHVLAAIEGLPTTEERKKGKWVVYKAPDKYHCGLVKCPFCGEEMIAEADEYNYCPNCGADMRGEGHECFIRTGD